MSAAAKIKGALVTHLPDPMVFRIAPVLYRRQEPELARLRSFVPADMTAVDIGGWLGPWTRELARWCPQVHTFEPQPDLAAYLRRVVPSNVTIHENAVSDRAGTLPLVVPSADAADKALASLDREAPADALVHTVEVVRLDDVDLGAVGFVKIDVEGREKEVLDGATGLLEQSRPRLLLEAEQRHIEHPIGSLFETLDGLGYDGWFLAGGIWNPVAWFSVERDQLAHVDDVMSPAYINNFLFAPRETGFSPS